MKIRDLPKWRSLNISETLHKWLMGLKEQVSGTVNDASFLVVSESEALDSSRVWKDGKGIDTVDGGPGGNFTPSVDEAELSHALLGSLNTTNYSHLTAAQLADLTDAGESILHYHSSDRDSDNFFGTEWTDLTDGGESSLHIHDLMYPRRDQWLQNGFVSAADVDLSWDDGTRTLTVAPAATSFSYFCDGVLYAKSTAQTKAITDTEGLWIFYFDGATLTAVNAPTHSAIDAVIEDSCVVAWLYWDAANNDGRLFSELHGYRMSPATHHYLHDNIGAVYKTGMAIEDISTDGDGSDNAHAQFGLAEGAFYDEDLEVELDAIASTVGLEVWYLDGANWRWDTNAGYPVLTAGTGRLAWNSSGSVVEVDNTKFVLCHVFATNICQDDGTSPYYIAIMGQAQYSTLAAARVGAETEMGNLATGALPMPEIVPVATVIYQTQDSYTNAVNARTRSTASGEDWVDWRTSNIVASGAILDHGGLAGLTDDDHPGYLWTAGRSGGQSGAGGTAAGESLALEGSSHASGGPITLNGNLSVAANGIVTLTLDGASAQIIQEVYGSGIAPEFIGQHAANTLADPDPTVANSSLVKLTGRSWDGSAWVDALTISMQSAALCGANEAGSKIRLQTILVGDTGRVLDDRVVIDGYGNVIINADTNARPDSMYAGLVMKASIAPTANVDADCVCLYTKDVTTGHAFWHAMDEGEQEYTLVGAIQKTTTGDPTATHKSVISVNTEDDTVKMVCEKGGAALGWNEFLFVEDANFRGYKAIAMACDNGTTFPTSPAPTTGQWFYRSDTKTLWFYEGGWKPVVSFGDVTLYVNGSIGGDEPPDGWAEDLPTATIQAAIDKIPGLNGGNVVVNIAAGTYAPFVIQGKSFYGNFSLKIVGTMTAALATQTAVSATAYSSGTQATLTDTGVFAGGSYALKILRITGGTGYISTSGLEWQNDYIIESHTDDVLTIIGTWWGSTPDGSTTYQIKDFGVTVDGSSAAVSGMKVLAGQQATKAYYMKFLNCYDAGVDVQNYSSCDLYTCYVSGGTTGTLLVVYRGFCTSRNINCVIGNADNATRGIHINYYSQTLYSTGDVAYGVTNCYMKCINPLNVNFHSELGYNNGKGSKYIISQSSGSGLAWIGFMSFAEIYNSIFDGNAKTKPCLYISDMASVRMWAGNEFKGASGGTADSIKLDGMCYLNVSQSGSKSTSPAGYGVNTTNKSLAKNVTTNITYTGNTYTADASSTNT